MIQVQIPVSASADDVLSVERGLDSLTVVVDLLVVIAVVVVEDVVTVIVSGAAVHCYDQISINKEGCFSIHVKQK